MYYVYTLTDPRDNKVFYVGKGKGNRINAHELEAKRSNETEKQKRINAIWAQDLSVIKKIVKRFNDELKAYQYEDKLIKKFGLENLTNMVCSGTRKPIYIDENEQRDKIYLQIYRKLALLKASDLEPHIRLCGLHKIDEARIAQWNVIAEKVIARRGEEWSISVLANR